jgi:hypothetical protein
MQSPAILALLVLLGQSCHADEAICRDGRRFEGSAKLDAGRLCFVPADPKRTVPLVDIAYIHFADAVVPPALFGTPVRVELANSQHLTGELLALDEDSLCVRTFWTDKLSIPRRSVVAITHPPGLITIHHEDFEGDPISLKRTGVPPLDDSLHTSGRRSLKLSTAGQSAKYVLPEPLHAGRFGVNFHGSGEASGALWLVEADFNGKRRVSITPAGNGDKYVVETDVAGEHHSLQRSPGWHRLSVRFRANYLLVGVDGRLLFESGKQGPAAPLTAVRLACVARSPSEAVRGAVHFDDLSLAKPLDELARPPVDASHDELWLLPGDQLFGRIARADRRAIEIHGRFGKRSLPWSAVRGIFFKAGAPVTKAVEGEHVRVWLRSGFAETDELDFVLRSLGADKITMRHPLLGDLEFDRARVDRLRP